MSEPIPYAEAAKAYRAAVKTCLEQGDIFTAARYEETAEGLERHAAEDADQRRK